MPPSPHAFMPPCLHAIHERLSWEHCLKMCLLPRRGDEEPGFLLEALCSDAGDARWAPFCAAFTAWALAAGAAPDLAHTRGLVPGQAALDARCLRARFLTPDLARLACAAPSAVLGGPGGAGGAAAQHEPCEGWPVAPEGAACEGAAPQGGGRSPALEPSTHEPCGSPPSGVHHRASQVGCPVDEHPGRMRGGPGSQGHSQLGEASTAQAGAAAQHCHDHTLPSGPLMSTGGYGAAGSAAAPAHDLPAQTSVLAGEQAAGHEKGPAAVTSGGCGAEPGSSRPQSTAQQPAEGGARAAETPGARLASSSSAAPAAAQPAAAAPAAGGPVQERGGPRHKPPRPAWVDVAASTSA